MGAQSGARLLALASIALALAGCGLANTLAERGLSSGPNGIETPASVGLAFERVAITSGDRHLDGYFVEAAADCERPPALLLFHGAGETISDWVAAQRFLHDACVTSLAFDYTGSGDSSRPARYDAINDDAVAAYEFLLARLAPDQCVFTLGHSMGAGHMIEAARQWSRPPEGLVVANAFASMRAAMSRVRGYSVFAPVMPNWWNNVENVSRVGAPILVIHSQADQVNPIGDGERIFAAASEPKVFIRVSELDHGALYRQPSSEFWAPVLEFMGRRCRGTARSIP